MWLIPAILALVFISFLISFFPFVAALLFPARKKSLVLEPAPRNIDVIVPCHNEEGRLRTTLESVSHATDELHRYYPEVEVRIRCGLDACSDTTWLDAAQFDAEIVTFKHRSKWKVISDLVSSSNSDWIILVDAGVTWDRRILRNSIPFLAVNDVVSFSPSYTTARSGLPGRLHWALEAFIKSYENRSGGPISVHGATVFYRSSSLKLVLRVLAGRAWINDDVVIPLMMRCVFPGKRIIYSRNSAIGFTVCDRAPRAPSSEKIARERVARGNIQWIRFLVPIVIEWNIPVFIVSMRRIARLYWAIVPIAISFSTSVAIFEYFPSSVLIGFALASFSMCLQLFTFYKIPGFMPSIRSLFHLITGKREQKENVLWQ